MKDEKMTELIIKISTELATLNTNMRRVLDNLADHEKRLTQLEQNKMGFKDIVVVWAVKGLVVALITIGSLTGAAGLIKGVLGL